MSNPCLEFDKTITRCNIDYFFPRYEAASAAVGDTMFVMGGIGESSVEFVNAGRKGAKWQSGPSLPAVTARACAAAVDGDTVILSGGHGNGSAGSVRSAHMLSAREDGFIGRFGFRPGLITSTF